MPRPHPMTTGRGWWSAGRRSVRAVGFATPPIARRARLARRTRNPLSLRHADEPLAKVRHEGSRKPLAPPGAPFLRKGKCKRDRAFRALAEADANPRPEIGLSFRKS